jgi:arylsulfatase A-like enzyme
LRVVGRTIAAAVVVAAVVGCQPTSQPEAARPNLLVILVDALRADRLGAYGSTRGLTPFLDSLAARGVVFQHAYSAAPWTNASVASLFTSRHVWQHGVTSPGAVLADSEVTVAEALRDHGYATAARTANFLIGQSNGFTQGFASYLSPPPRQVEGFEGEMLWRAGELSGSALEWWRDAQGERGPAFLYLHYVETHAPYAPPAQAVEYVFRGRAWPDIDKVNAISGLFLNLLPADDPNVRDVDGLYDTEVMAIDMALAQFFADLEREGFLPNAVVMITADHGEALWDHGVFGHGGSLFNELIHVPLIVYVPGLDTRVDVSEVVSLIDVAPTLLDFAGIPPPASFSGHSFRALMAPPSWRNLFGFMPRSWQGAGPWPGVALSDMAFNPKSVKEHPTSHHRAVVVGSHKLVTTLDGRTEFYDLARDPLEKAPDGVTETERAALAQALARIGPPPGKDPVVAEVKPLDEQQKQRLRALGYAQ